MSDPRVSSSRPPVSSQAASAPAASGPDQRSEAADRGTGVPQDRAEQVVAEASPHSGGQVPVDPELKREADALKVLGMFGLAPTPPPTMTATGKYSTPRGQVIEFQFDRPVSRTEAERFLYPGGKLPDEYTDGYIGARDPTRRPVLENLAGRGQQSRQWALFLPEYNLRNWDLLNAGVEDKLQAAKDIVPSWIPQQSRQTIDSHHIPKPGDPRFDSVKSDFAKPHESVTVWRDGDSVFRVDASTGQLSAFRYQTGRYDRLVNKLMKKYVEDEGMDVESARKRMAKEVGENNLNAVLMFVLGGMRGS